jgi:hypothetical protein
MADLLSAVDWISALLFAGAIGMTALTHREIRYARLVVLIATILLGLRWGAWALMSDQSWVIKSLVGACVGAFIFGAIPPALTWIRSKSLVSDSDPSTVTTHTTADSPPIGSIRYITATLILDHSHSLDEWAGQVQVGLENTTDKLIFFRAMTAGNINGMAFAAEKVTFEGYIQPRDHTKIFSNRIVGFKIDPHAGFIEPIAVAFFEYDIGYGFIEEKTFHRRTAKGLRIEFRSPLPDDRPVGSVIQGQTTVIFYQEREE